MRKAPATCVTGALRVWLRGPDSALGVTCSRADLVLYAEDAGRAFLTGARAPSRRTCAKNATGSPPPASPLARTSGLWSALPPRWGHRPSFSGARRRPPALRGMPDGPWRQWCSRSRAARLQRPPASLRRPAVCLPRGCERSRPAVALRLPHDVPLPRWRAPSPRWSAPLPRSAATPPRLRASTRHRFAAPRLRPAFPPPTRADARSCVGSARRERPPEACPAGVSCVPWCGV
jgi:hypothetical protein